MDLHVAELPKKRVAHKWPFPISSSLISERKRQSRILKLGSTHCAYRSTNSSCNRAMSGMANHTHAVRLSQVSHSIIASYSLSCLAIYI